MLEAQDVLRLCGEVGCFGQETEDRHQLQSTPSWTRPKRQRLQEASAACITACGSSMIISTSVPSGCTHQPAETQPGSAECTPPATARATAPLTPAPAALPWQASQLLDYVQGCLEGLIAMYPVCAFIRENTKAAEMAVCLFRHVYLGGDASIQAQLLRERLLAQAVLAACLWVAIKFEATRTTIPDSRIMSRITGIPAGLLLKQEREVLEAVGWDLMLVAREAGAIDIDDNGDSKAAPCLIEPPAAAFQALRVNPTSQDAAALAAALLSLNSSPGCGVAALPSSLLPHEGLAGAGSQE